MYRPYSDVLFVYVLMSGFVRQDGGFVGEEYGKRRRVHDSRARGNQSSFLLWSVRSMRSSDAFGRVLCDPLTLDVGFEFPVEYVKSLCVHWYDTLMSNNAELKQLIVHANSLFILIVVDSVYVTPFSFWEEGWIMTLYVWWGRSNPGVCSCCETHTICSSTTATVDQAQYRFRCKDTA